MKVFLFSYAVEFSRSDNSITVYYCRCAAECQRNDKDNYDRVNIDRNSDKFIGGLNPNTLYCFFNDLRSRTVDFRVRTAPANPANYQIIQTNPNTNPTALRASWTKSVPDGENYALTYRSIVRNAITLAEISRTTTTTLAQLFTATALDFVALYDLQASNLDTEPANNIVIYSAPITIRVAIPSPPQISSVTFTTSTATISISKISTLSAITSEICVGTVCTTTANTVATLPWTANTRQTITVTNIYASDFNSTSDTLIESSPPLTATQGSFSVLNSTTIRLDWIQPASGTLSIVWLIVIKNSIGQVIVPVTAAITTSFLFHYQPGSAYYAEIISYNGYRGSIDPLIISFGAVPLPPVIQSFRVSPLLTTVSISHIHELDQNIYYLYTWRHAMNQQQLRRINSNQTSVVWNHQGVHFGTPIVLQVVAGNSFGVSNITQLLLLPQSTSVGITTISEGVYSFKVVPETIFPIQRYFLMIKDGNKTLATNSSSSIDTFVLSTLPPVTSCTILTAIDVLVDNRNISTTAAMLNNSFITAPLSMISLDISQRNETSLLFSYKDSPYNPPPKSILLQLFDYSNPSVALYKSTSLRFANITASSKYYANITLYYQYEQSNTPPTTVLVTTPPFPPQFVESEFVSNDYFALQWKPSIQGYYNISFYNINVWIQDSSEPSVLAATFLTNETQWETTNVIPNAKYTIEVSSTNSEDISSIRTLNYEFFSYPSNPVHQKTVYADYLILKWKMPATVHPSLTSFSYSIVYHLENDKAQNKTIKFTRNYQPLADVVYAILNLNPLQIYVFNIQTTAHYKNGLNMTSNFGSADQAITTKADPPSSAPTVYPIDTDYVTTNSFVVTWDTISTTLNAKLHFFTIFLNYSDAGVIKSNESYYYVSSEEPTYSTVIMDLPPATTFLVSITGSNIGGSSPLSNAVTVTTKGGTTDNLIATIIPSIIIPIIGICILICIITLVILIIIVGILVSTKRKQRQTYLAYEMKESMLPKEFATQYIIEPNLLSFTDSVVLGTGAQGTVCTATYRGVAVAVKIYPRILFGVENDFTDFYNESKSMAEFSNHMNIVRFIGISEDLQKDQLMLITELCKGGNVASFAEKHGLSFSDWKQKMHILKGVAAGMTFLHSKNVAHRDLKCENVLLDDSLNAKIIDFGFTKQIKETAGDNKTVRFGTACYLAPEAVSQLSMFRNSSISMLQDNHLSVNMSLPTLQNEPEINTNRSQLVKDLQCDIYSFAIIMYVLLTGKIFPYGKQASDVQILHQMHMNPNFRPIISQEIEQFVQKHNLQWYIDLMKECWSTDAELRPSFANIISQLQKH